MRNKHLSQEQNLAEEKKKKNNNNNNNNNNNQKKNNKSFHRKVERPNNMEKTGVVVRFTLIG